MFFARLRPPARTSHTEETTALAPITVLAMRSSKNLSHRQVAATKRHDLHGGGVTESNCPKFCWLDLTAAFCGKYRAAEFRSYLLTYRSK